MIDKLLLVTILEALIKAKITLLSSRTEFVCSEFRNISSKNFFLFLLNLIYHKDLVYIKNYHNSSFFFF